MHKSIGGYPALELGKGHYYHARAMHLNLGRNCLEHIIRSRKYTKVYVPHYTCSAVIEPLCRLGIEIIFYDIDINFELITLPETKEGEALLYINYFGLKSEYARKLSIIYGSGLIVDNTQGFYAARIEGIDTFYSARKFFGVTDGADVYCDIETATAYPQDYSYERMAYLVKRIDLGAESGYADFQECEHTHEGQGIKQMSHLTYAILDSVDYDYVRIRRRRNFEVLHNALKDSNRVTVALSEDDVPMIYPYLIDNDMRANLIDERIYVPKYWPELGDCYSQNDTEKAFRNRLLALPVSQEYDDRDMDIIIKTIYNHK